MNWSKGRKIIIIGLAVLAIGAFIGHKMLYKPHKKTIDQKAAFVGNAEEFKTQVTQSQQKWQNAIVELKGKVSNLDKQGFSLNESIFCQLEDSLMIQKIKPQMSITIKGRFIGYDDLLEEIKLDQCIVR